MDAAFQVSPIWFSHKENLYNVEKKLGKRKFRWTKNSHMWDWRDCTVTGVKTEQEKIRIVIRSSHKEEEGRNLNYMLGFVISHIGNLEEDIYDEPIDNLINDRGEPHPRWILKLDEDHFIWQWREKGKSKENCELAAICQELKNIQEKSYDPSNSNIFHVPSLVDNNDLVPVIYQPAVDSMYNYLTGIDCFRNINNEKIEVTLTFISEHLRKNKALEPLYKRYHDKAYLRTTDIESFDIKLENGACKEFQFRGIYSGLHSLEYDSIHGDKPKKGKAPYHPIRYFFANENHPIVFVNTANHAMSFHDTNPKIWKWEYIPWTVNSRIKLGDKPRDKLEPKWALFPKMIAPVVEMIAPVVEVILYFYSFFYSWYVKKTKNEKKRK